jgi:hypothetical protein
VFFSIARDIKQRLSETDSKPEVQHFFDKSGAVVFLLCVILALSCLQDTIKIKPTAEGEAAATQSSACCGA